MPKTLINDAQIWYDVRGQGAPLLLHHGYTASRVNWMPVADRLMDRYQIIMMECRGTGESEHTATGYTIAQYARDVVGLLDHLGKKTNLFGTLSQTMGRWVQVQVKSPKLFSENIHSVIFTANIQKCPKPCNT